METLPTGINPSFMLKIDETARGNRPFPERPGNPGMMLNLDEPQSAFSEAGRILPASGHFKVSKFLKLARAVRYPQHDACFS